EGVRAGVGGLCPARAARRQYRQRPSRLRAGGAPCRLFLRPGGAHLRWSDRMTDEPQVPPEPGSPEPGSSDAPPPSEASQTDHEIEAMADEVAADEAEEAEQGDAQAAAEAEVGAAPADSGPPPTAERGPSKLALLAVALLALLAGAGTAYALGHKGGGCPPKGDAL